MIISGKFYNENSSEYTTLKKEELDFYTTPSINNPKLDDMSTNNIKECSGTNKYFICSSKEIG